MEILWKLKPFVSKKIWGHENWLLSCRPEGACHVSNGSYGGLTLHQALQKLAGKKEGQAYRYRAIASDASKFPLLVKTIHTQQKLSVQVHPGDFSDALGKKISGKTECWYFLAAEKKAVVFAGFDAKLALLAKAGKVSPKKLLQKLLEKSDEEFECLLRGVEVNAGDFFYIPAGIVHALGARLQLLEVQQNSDITYRLYDYGRKRQLHIKKGLAVANTSACGEYIEAAQFQGKRCRYFTVSKKLLDFNSSKQATKNLRKKGHAGSMRAYFLLDEGKLRFKHSLSKEVIRLSAYDCLYTPLNDDLHGLAEYIPSGRANVMEITGYF